MPRTKEKPVLKNELEDLNVRIGKAMRRARKERQLTQEDLAAHVGLSTFFVGSVERGQATISLRALTRIADVLNTTVGELIDEPPADVEAMRRQAVQVLKTRIADRDVLAVLTMLMRFAATAP